MNKEKINECNIIIDNMKKEKKYILVNDYDNTIEMITKEEMNKEKNHNDSIYHNEIIDSFIYDYFRESTIIINEDLQNKLIEDIWNKFREIYIY
jgi:hypothetical protein